MLFTGIMFGISATCAAAALVLHRREKVLLLTRGDDADAIIPTLLQQSFAVLRNSKGIEQACDLIRRAIGYLDHLPADKSHLQQLQAAVQAVFQRCIATYTHDRSEGLRHLRWLCELNQQLPVQTEMQVELQRAEAVMKLAFQDAWRSPEHVGLDLLRISRQFHERGMIAGNDEAAVHDFQLRMVQAALEVGSDPALALMLDMRNTLSLNVEGSSYLLGLQHILVDGPYWRIFCEKKFQKAWLPLKQELLRLARNRAELPAELAKAFAQGIRDWGAKSAVTYSEDRHRCSSYDTADDLAELALAGWLTGMLELEIVAGRANSLAIQLLKHLLKLSEKEFGGNDPRVCRFLVLLGGKKYDQHQRGYGRCDLRREDSGCCDQGDAEFRRAVGIFEQADRDKYPDLCRLIRDCANICPNGKMRNVFFDQALRCAEASFAKNDPELVEFVVGKMQVTEHNMCDEYVDRLMDMVVDGVEPAGLDRQRLLTVGNKHFNKRNYQAAARIFLYLESLYVPPSWMQQLRNYFNPNPHAMNFQEIKEKRLICQKAMQSAAS